MLTFTFPFILIPSIPFKPIAMSSTSNLNTEVSEATSFHGVIKSSMTKALKKFIMQSQRVLIGLNCWREKDMYSPLKLTQGD